MKNAKEIKKELEKKGYITKDIKIRVVKEHEFIWVNVSNLMNTNILAKDISEITGLPLYNMQVSMNFKKG